jgi:large subunit ribosomal protein L18
MKRERRHKRVRSKISGTAQRPRLVVFRSNTRVVAQLIDDEKRHTLAAVEDVKSKSKDIGRIIAQKAKEQKIKTVVFDRGGYKYHGHIKAVAEAAREEGVRI